MKQNKCQCPFGLLFISTIFGKAFFAGVSVVSMPIRASLHFHFYNEEVYFFRSVCQCPFGLLFISTEPEPKPEPMCQCPFGLLFISTRPLLLYSEENRMCQCPFGLLFISTAQRKEAIMMDSSVSMPIRASLHFHVVTVKGQPVNVVSCQYPFGLLFISTIPVRYIA